MALWSPYEDHSSLTQEEKMGTEGRHPHPQKSVGREALLDTTRRKGARVGAVYISSESLKQSVTVHVQKSRAMNGCTLGQLIFSFSYSLGALA